MKIHLGCNDIVRMGYVNVDRWFAQRPEEKGFTRNGTPPLASGRVWRHLEDEHTMMLEADLAKPWPFSDGYAEKIIAHDVFEHIENEQFRGSKGIIWCLNEAHRVLKPGGVLDLKVPCLDFEKDGTMVGGMGVFCDPTHVQVWTADTRYYFDERWIEEERGRLGPGMGITALFRTLPRSQSGVDWKPIIYAPKHPERRKLMLELEAVK